MSEASLVGSVPPAPKNELSRTLKSRHVSMITFGGIIGAGLFVGSSTAISTIGPAAVLSYALAGFLVLLVMRMISEMAMAMPGVQTFPEFARVGVGEWAGFLVGWLYWYFWVVVIAIEAIAPRDNRSMLGGRSAVTPAAVPPRRRLWFGPSCSPGACARTSRASSGRCSTGTSGHSRSIARSALAG